MCKFLGAKSEVFCQKTRIFLHISIFLCNFAAQNVKIAKTMNPKEPKQAPIGTDSTGIGTPQQMYFTADEAIAFLEPRIRAMFK